MIANKKKVYDTTLKTQDRHNKSKQELINIKEQMISLQESTNNLEKKLRFCNEKINWLQDSLATTQANIAQACPKARASPTLSTLTSKRFVKFLNSSIFINNNNLSFED